MKPVEQNSLNSFTRGGQFLNNFFVMAKQNIIRIFLSGLLITIIVGWASWYRHAHPQSRYVLVNESIIRLTLLVNNTANREVSVMHSDGTRTITTLQQRLNVPRYDQDVRQMEADFKRAFYVGLFWGLLAMLGVTWLAARIGFSLGKDKHVRGARLQSPRTVQKQIAKYNEQQAKLQNNPDYVPYNLAGVDYPFRAETQHTMMVGSTGSGKTQGISLLLTQIYERGDRGVFYDKMRSFIERFYDPSRDIILNPLDARCPAWDMFADARHLVDWENIAEAIIPNENTEYTYFEQTARSVFAHTAHRVVKRCERQGTKPRISDLIFMLTSSTDEGLHNFLKGSPAELHIDPDNQRTTGSIRSTLGNAIRSLGYLKDPVKGEKPFSIREWIKDDDRASVVYLTSRDDIHAVLQPLLTMWISIFTSAQMSQPRSSTRTIWYGLDELPSLNRLPNLESALAEARQYGAAYLIGIQLISQLRQIYGRDGADTILGLTRNKLVFNPGDPITAELMTQFIGKQEVNRKDHSMSVGATELRDGQSVSNRLTQELIIMPEELSQLPSLTGILSFTGNFPVCRVTIDYLSLEGPESGFIEDENAIRRAEDMYSRGRGVTIEHANPSEVEPRSDVEINQQKPTETPFDVMSGYSQGAAPEENISSSAADKYADFDNIEGDVSGYGRGAQTDHHQAESRSEQSSGPSVNGRPTAAKAPMSTAERAMAGAAALEAKSTSASNKPSSSGNAPRGSLTVHSPKLIPTADPNVASDTGDGGGGVAAELGQQHSEMLEANVDSNGISPVTTAMAKDMRGKDRSEANDAEETEEEKRAERLRRNLELFGEAATAMPSHGGRGDAPDHFQGGGGR